jgi:YHS domain-containing protein
MVSMAIDPVCGMNIEQDKAVPLDWRDGQVVYFCAAGCRDEFLADPQRFILPDGQAGNHL